MYIIRIDFEYNLFNFQKTKQTLISNINLSPRNVENLQILAKINEFFIGSEWEARTKIGSQPHECL